MQTPYLVRVTALDSMARWLGIQLREDSAPPESEPIESQIPARSEGLTTDTALTLSSVYRAVSLLGTAAMQLTLDLWREDKPLEKDRLVRKPDVDTHLPAWLEANVMSLALSGNAYWEVMRDADYRPYNIRVLNPWECTLDVKKNELWHKGRVFKDREFKHLKLTRVPGQALGLGPIQACRLELTGIRDLRDYASDWFRSGDVPSGLLTSEQVLTEEQAKQYKEMWQKRPAHEIAVMGSGLDYKPVMLNPVDAQFLENQQFSVTQVARMFGIPARHMLAAVEGSSHTYANLAQEDLTFVRWTLMRYLREIEAAFSDVLPGLQSVKFNLDAILRADTKGRYDAHKVALDAGFLTVNEVRQIEGLTTMTGGDTLREPKPTPAATETNIGATP